MFLPNRFPNISPNIFTTFSQYCQNKITEYFKIYYDKMEQQSTGVNELHQIFWELAFLPWKNWHPNLGNASWKLNVSQCAQIDGFAISNVQQSQFMSGAP